MSGAVTDGELTNLALCWRLERTDGAGLALTSHDRTIVAGGDRYSPAPGMMPASITRSLGLDPDIGEASGALSSEALDDDDLSAGRWNGAAIALDAVDWIDPLRESFRLLGGEIGSVAMRDNAFTCDLAGAASRLAGPVCPSTSAECRAHFGDRSCRVDLAGRSVRATVIAVEDNRLTLDRALDDRFLFGRLRYLQGESCGLSSIVLAVEGAVIQLRNSSVANLHAGCRVELREGCDKRFETCVTRFDNAVNFRGEPHLPGSDLLTRYPGA